MAAALPFLALAAAGMGAVAQLKSGQAQASGLRSQAMQTRMKAKGESLKYKQQGVAVLENILQTQSTLNARGAAGGIDPFSGSANALQQYALAQGAKENYTTMDNAIIAIRSGEMQANEYESAARSAMSQAKMGAIMTMLQGAGSYAMLGGPGFGGAGAGAGAVAGSATGAGGGTLTPFGGVTWGQGVGTGKLLPGGLVGA
tara:strand:+ start:483 stop:1085 length:603 start_codon:yes stop_codon:yes gene_type:complete